MAAPLPVSGGPRPVAPTELHPAAVPGPFSALFPTRFILDDSALYLSDKCEVETLDLQRGGQGLDGGPLPSEGSQPQAAPRAAGQPHPAAGPVSAPAPARPQGLRLDQRPLLRLGAGPGAQREEATGTSLAFCCRLCLCLGC